LKKNSKTGAFPLPVGFCFCVGFFHFYAFLFVGFGFAGFQVLAFFVVLCVFNYYFYCCFIYRFVLLKE